MATMFMLMVSSRLLTVQKEPVARGTTRTREHRTERVKLVRETAIEDKVEDDGVLKREKGEDVNRVRKRVQETRGDFTAFVTKKVRFKHPIGKEWIQQNVVPWAMRRIEKNGKSMRSRAFRKWSMHSCIHCVHLLMFPSLYSCSIMSLKSQRMA
jgi:hypothetical protein